MAKRWTKKQTAALLDGIGSFGWHALQRRSGHTKQEIQQKIQREFGGGGVTRGSYSLAQAMSETGYARTQFERARLALNQRWVRTCRGGDYLITAEQLEDMANWLATDYWCSKLRLYVCTNCEESVRPHHSLGLCFRCYHRTSRWVRRTMGTTLTTAALSHFFEGIVPLSEPESLAVDLILRRLRDGKCPSMSDMERVLEWNC